MGCTVAILVCEYNSSVAWMLLLSWNLCAFKGDLY